LQRWEWLFSENSRKLVASKRRRKARPVVLPLSPVVDYSQHEKIIQILDRALEENAYVSFSYTPPSRSWDDPPQQYFHLEPYELEYRDGHWYFTAYLSDLDTFLDFRVDRIRLDSLKGLDPDHFSPGAHRRTGVKIQYWVSPMMARHQSVSARLQDQRVEFLENDGGAIIEGYAKSI
jgi:predicted DNA-binding transcriptional regulator YafY